MVSRLFILFCLGFVSWITLNSGLLRAEDHRDLSAVLVEVPIESVLIPNHGFDNNDRIEAVVQGKLLNSCFTLAQAEFQREGSQIRIRQYAWQSKTPPCESGEIVTESMPFNSVLYLGVLDTADYTISYLTAQGSQATDFKVSASTWGGIDEAVYASINGVNLNATQSAGKDVVAEVQGQLLVNCAELFHPFKVERQGRIILVLPLVDFRPFKGCAEAVRPFVEKVSLGVFEPGEYLIHVRSREGKAVYRTFTVR